MWVRPRRDIFTSRDNPSVKIQFIVTPNCRDAGGCFLAVVEKKTILVNS